MREKRTVDWEWRGEIWTKTKPRSAVNECEEKGGAGGGTGGEDTVKTRQEEGSNTGLEKKQ